MYGSPLAPPAAPPPAFAPPIAQLPPPPPPPQPVPGPNAVQNAKRDQRRKDNAKAGSVVRALAPAAKPPPAASAPSPQADAQAATPQSAPSPVPEPLPQFGTLINQNAQGNTVLASLSRIVMGIESSGGANPNPSPSGAVGPMQVKLATAAQYGFDPRRVATDFAYNVKAGMFILSDLLQRSGGDPIKAAIGYNAGPGAMDTPLPGLSAETRNYVARVASALDAQRAATMPATAAKPPPAKKTTPAASSASTAPWKDPNSAAEAPPQEAAPPPAATEATPTFTPAQYHAPAKGLEYLAAGLSILFPGTGIARLASSFGAGLGKRAEDTYARDEQAAEKGYGAAKDAAQIAFENENAQRQSAIEANAVAFANQKIKYDAAQALRRQGIDPVTQKPFVLPPNLMRVLPPGQGRPATAADYVRHESALAQFYTSVGATDLAEQHLALAGDYNKQVLDDLNNARALTLAMYREQHEDQRAATTQAGEDRRAEFREAAEDARHADTEAHEDQREAIRLAHEDARAAQTDASKRDTLRTEAATAGRDFYTLWRKGISPPTEANGQPRTLKNPDGTPQTDPSGAPKIAPPQIGPALQSSLGKLFSTLDRDTDPITTAQHYADATTDPLVKELILARGKSADLTRRARGVPIVPHSYAKLPNVAAPTDPLRAAGLNPDDPRVAAEAKKFTDNGLPIDAAAIAAIKKDLGQP